MKVLAVLLVSFLIAAIATKLINGEFDWVFSGNVAMCVMLCFTAIGHFVFVKGMEMMMPPFIPFKRELVVLTGIIEIAGGIGLLFPSYRYWVAILLIVFFILILPANIYATIKNVDFQKASFDGPGANYLWFRIPMQIFLIGWIWYFSIDRS